MSYLLNTWYMAAWASEVKEGKLFHRKLLDEPIVLFRKQDGTPVALRDRCPHRSFWDLKPVLLQIDTAAVLARRILAKKIEAEKADR